MSGTRPDGAPDQGPGGQHDGRPDGGADWLTTTYRPLGVRVVSAVASAALCVTAVVITVSLSPEIRAQVTFPQLLTLGVVLALVLTVLYALARTSVRADDTHLHVVNGFRRHDLEWAQIVSAQLGRGAPWAELDLADGETLAVVAIQGADGDRARHALHDLRRAIRHHG